MSTVAEKANFLKIELAKRLPHSPTHVLYHLLHIHLAP